MMVASPGLNGLLSVLARARMVFGQKTRGFWGLALTLVLAGGLFVAPSFAATKKKSTRKTTSSSTRHSTSHRGKRSRKSASWRRGQQKMDSTRAREVQQALIREHYLDGTATGNWDQASQRAMVKFQADNGWQTKVVPDSRALIKLGLGPNHDHLLNPESAMTGPIPSSTVASRPDAPGSSSMTPTATDSATSTPQK